MQSESLTIGVKTVGTMTAIHLTPYINPADVPAILEIGLQIIVAIGGLISLLRKKKKEQ